LGSGIWSQKLVLERINSEVGSMGVGAGVYMYAVVVKVHVRYLSYIEYLMHTIVSNNKLKVGMD